MDLSQFDYHLPESLIAQFPTDSRSGSRLMVVKPSYSETVHTQFSQVIDFLNPGDLVVVNDTRVIPARIFARKPTGGGVEIMLERVESDKQALVLLGSNKPIKLGQVILVDQYELIVEGRHGPFFRVCISGNQPISELFESYGTIPLPPYIDRNSNHNDKERYQTIYSKHLGAVAAPTAGLHFDQPLVDQIRNKGVQWTSVTLHVGAGTFQPVRVNNVTDHTMHQERISVSQNVCEQIMQTRAEGGRIVAVGTTVVRALESAAISGTMSPDCTETELFILPGYKFNIVDALITNFHLPKSTLLMMVSAFSGYDQIMAAYREAIQQKYRFFSYGDAMFLERM